MKKTAVLLALAAMLCSCINVNVNGGNTVKCAGEVVERDMAFSGFTGIKVEGAAEIDFCQANTFKVLVTANEEVFNYLDYTIKGNDLVLSTINHVNISAKVYKVLIEAPVITSIDIEGAAKMHLPGGYSSSEKLEIEIDGAGKLDFRGIDVPTLDLQINGAGEFDLAGIKVGTLEIEVNGAGKGAVSGVADFARISVAGTARINTAGLQCPSIEKHVDGLAVIK